MSAFTVISGSDEHPNWLDMRPGHFDVTKLPKGHRKPDPGALWTIADLYQPEAVAAETASELDGQADLFSETD